VCAMVSIGQMFAQLNTQSRPKDASCIMVKRERERVCVCVSTPSAPSISHPFRFAGRRNVRTPLDDVLGEQVTGHTVFTYSLVTGHIVVTIFTGQWSYCFHYIFTLVTGHTVFTIYSLVTGHTFIHWYTHRSHFHTLCSPVVLNVH